MKKNFDSLAARRLVDSQRAVHRMNRPFHSNRERPRQNAVRSRRLTGARRTKPPHSRKRGIVLPL